MIALAQSLQIVLTVLLCIIECYFVKLVIDLSPSDGNMWWACIQLGLNYVAVCFTEEHRNLLLTRMATLYKANMANPQMKNIYNARYAAALEKARKTQQAGDEESADEDEDNQQAEEEDEMPPPTKKPKVNKKKNPTPAKSDGNDEEGGGENPAGDDDEDGGEEEAWDPLAADEDEQLEA